MRVTHAFWAVLGILLIAGNAVGELWTPPVLVSGINTSFEEAAPFPTYDGLTLYFSRLGLPAPSGRLYSATRPTSSGPFTSESEWIGLNEGGHSVTYSWGSPDNLRLYY